VKCVVGLAQRAYERKTKNCEACGAELSCLKAHHYTQAARLKMEKRLQHTGVYFGKVGMTPRYYSRDGPNVPEDDKKRIQNCWVSAVEQELHEAPDFAETTLNSVKRRKVEFLYSGSKWD
jgi:hypothetical protein